MDKPEKFGVVIGGTVTDLPGTLKEKKIDGKLAWETTFKTTKSGDLLFFLQTKPLWEPAEDMFHVQMTKVIVKAEGEGETPKGWDKPIAASGISAEIVPLTRPYSLVSGNLFTGQVLRDGKPVPGVEVEVEYWGTGKTKSEKQPHLCQVVKTDPNGIFSFAMPKAGWWGFVAVMQGDAPMKYEGKDKKVELGAVIWVKARPLGGSGQGPFATFPCPCCP